MSKDLIFQKLDRSNDPVLLSVEELVKHFSLWKRMYPNKLPDRICYVCDNYVGESCCYGYEYTEQNCIDGIKHHIARVMIETIKDCVNISMEETTNG